MASMTLFVASSLKSVTVHANNNYYPKTFGQGSHTLSNLPSSGNIWIVPANDVTFASGYGSPVNVTTQNPSGSWKLDNDNYISITNGRSITLTGTKSGAPSYSTNSIYFRIGTGISSYRMQYANATKEGLLSDYINSNYNSTVLAVRSGTNAVLYGVSYADGYEAPFRFVE